MPIELVNMQTATPFDRLRLALVGKQKVGKSRLAATGRPGVLLWDYDKRWASIAGYPNVYVIEPTEPAPTNTLPNPCPEAFQKGLDYVRLLEEKRSFRHLGFKVPDGQLDTIQTAVVDSMQSIAAAAQRYALYNTADIRRTITVGSYQTHLVKNFDGWNAEMQMVNGFIDRLLAIAGLDVIITLHEQPEEMPESTTEKPKYSGRVDVFPGRYRNILGSFNEVWRLTRNGAGAPTIQAMPDFAFTAATNLDLPTQPEANIKKLIADHLVKHPPTKFSAS